MVGAAQSWKRPEREGTKSKNAKGCTSDEGLFEYLSPAGPQPKACLCIDEKRGVVPRFSAGYRGLTKPTGNPTRFSMGCNGLY